MPRKLLTTVFLFFKKKSHHTIYGILVPQPGIKLSPPALEAWSLNPRTTGEVPCLLFTVCVFLIFYNRHITLKNGKKIKVETLWIVWKGKYAI